MTTEINLDLSLKTEECRRCQDIIERDIATEQGCSEVDRAFLHRHSAECAECASYLEMLDLLRDFEPDEAPVADAAIRAALNQRFTSKWRGRLVKMAIAAAALFVLGGAFLGYRATQKTGARGVRFELARGTIRIDHERIDEGAHFSFGDPLEVSIEKDALLKTHKALFIAAEADSAMRMIEATPTSVTLKLEKGRLALHLVPHSNVRLSVELPDGVVEVKGTVFAVEVERDTSRVSVIRGRVVVREGHRPEGRSQDVPAGKTYSLSNHEMTARPRNPDDPLLALLGIPDVNEAEIIENEIAEPEPDVERKPSAHGKEGFQATEKPSLESLIMAATTCRARRDWACAVKNYETLIRQYPNRPDASTAMVPAAQILLDNLGRPAQALRYFKRYQALRPTGSLGQEALWGECNAQRKLGRASQEVDCLKRYLRRYPGATFSSTAHSRLAEISPQ
jgi:hypothetical protein